MSFFLWSLVRVKLVTVLGCFLNYFIKLLHFLCRNTFVIACDSILHHSKSEGLCDQVKMAERYFRNVEICFEFMSSIYFTFFVEIFFVINFFIFQLNGPAQFLNFSFKKIKLTIQLPFYTKKFLLKN